MKKLMGKLMSELGYSFQDKALLRRALTRRSAIEEKVAEAATEDFQALELVGDGALKHVLAALLLQNNPAFTAGQLDLTLRPLIANDGVMVRIAASLNIDKYLIKGQGEIMDDKMRVDAIEAILGAISLDSIAKSKSQKGFIAVVRKLWGPYITGLVAAKVDVATKVKTPKVPAKPLSKGKKKASEQGAAAGAAAAAAAPWYSVLPAATGAASATPKSKKKSKKQPNLFAGLGDTTSLKALEKIIVQQPDLVEKQNKGQRGDTALMHLCRREQLRPDQEIAKMRLLLQHGAKWSAINKKGITALELLRTKHATTPEALGLPGGSVSQYSMSGASVGFFSGSDVLTSLQRSKAEAEEKADAVMRAIQANAKELGVPRFMPATVHTQAGEGSKGKAPLEEGAAASARRP